MIKCGIVGATGYAGVELVRILASHPEAEVAKVSSVSFEGQKLSDVYPSLSGICDLELGSMEDVVAGSDVVFAALPHGLSQQLCADVRAKGGVFIDLGADFRLDDPAVYTEWYGCEVTHPELHDEAVYGLCELNRDAIKATKVVGNPGCYPTATALGLMPAIKAGLVDLSRGFIVNAASGVTGAGRKTTQANHYPELNEAFYAYKAGNHRHTPEIEQTLSKIAGSDVKITFVPHLLPINRGILATIYADLKPGVTLDAVYDEYVKAYAGETFVRVKAKGGYANVKDVKYSNYCDISLHIDEHAGRLIICSAIDNMVKGAAGQAVQNMNLCFGLAEDCGLHIVPPAF